MPTIYGPNTKGLGHLLAECADDRSPFAKAVDHYCDGLHVAVGLSALCPECVDSCGIEDTGCIAEMQEEMYECAEPHFSWHQCDSCGSVLGGDRHAAHGIPHDYKAGDDTVIHLDICSDCLIYHANGDEPEEWHQSAADRREAEERQQDIDRAKALIDSAREEIGEDSVGLSRGGFSVVDLLADNIPDWTVDYCREIADEIGGD